MSEAGNWERASRREECVLLLISLLHKRWATHGAKTDRQLRVEWRIWRWAGVHHPRDSWWGFDGPQGKLPEPVDQPTPRRSFIAREPDDCGAAGFPAVEADPNLMDELPDAPPWVRWASVLLVAIMLVVLLVMA